jgi:methionyl-tRNA formyltransferase
MLIVEVYMDNIKNIPILFMGTPRMSADLLEHLIKEQYNIIAVVAQPGQCVGRKQILQTVPTKEVALKYGIPVYQPEKIKRDYEFLKELNFDLILCFAYGQIVPEEVLQMPKYGALNYHGSLLPKYRGAAPIQYALMNNDPETGVCLMEMVKKMDAGRVYAVEKFSLLESDNYETTSAKLVQACIAISDKYLQAYIGGTLPGVPQNEEEVTFAPSIKSEEERIDLKKGVKSVLGLIRALSPNVGAYVLFRNQVLKIFAATYVSSEVKAEVGTIVKADKHGLHLQCKGGIIAIKTLQKEGKKVMSYKDFINGEKDILNSKVE